MDFYWILSAVYLGYHRGCTRAWPAAYEKQTQGKGACVSKCVSSNKNDKGIDEGKWLWNPWTVFASTKSAANTFCERHILYSVVLS